MNCSLSFAYCYEHGKNMFESHVSLIDPQINISKYCRLDWVCTPVINVFSNLFRCSTKHCHPYETYGMFMNNLMLNSLSAKIFNIKSNAIELHKIELFIPLASNIILHDACIGAEI